MRWLSSCCCCCCFSSNLFKMISCWLEGRYFTRSLPVSTSAVFGAPEAALRPENFNTRDRTREKKSRRLHLHSLVYCVSHTHKGQQFCLSIFLFLFFFLLLWLNDAAGALGARQTMLCWLAASKEGPSSGPCKDLEVSFSYCSLERNRLVVTSTEEMAESRRPPFLLAIVNSIFPI